ncbi:hypothetical protein [Arthrobacter sp. 135MFCol5.1]|uniref:hypothetical protein n=1 Tax=Arthrobacter sp. 135MFCol5.1 TaxID=1158050 RepID=UPI00036EC74E|nr:hypothetical protein [Arthrobacter sp. 135MFCol5.1]
MNAPTAHAAAGSFPIERRTVTPQPPQSYRLDDWFHLPTTATVEIRRNGTYVRFARIEDATPDSRMLWLAPEGVDSRILIDKLDGYEVWIDAEQLYYIQQHR